MEFGFVWWVDASVKFTMWNISRAIKHTKQNGVLFFVSTDSIANASMTSHTDVRTFKYLNEDICKFRQLGEVWATTVMFYYNQISRAIVQAWVSCALNRDCIAPPGTENMLTCHPGVREDGHCHRFDQSVLSILIRRLFHERNLYPVDERLRKMFFISRREFVDYFEKCRFQFTCY